MRQYSQHSRLESTSPQKRLLHILIHQNSSKCSFLWQYLISIHGKGCFLTSREYKVKDQRGDHCVFVLNGSSRRRQVPCKHPHLPATHSVHVRATHKQAASLGDLTKPIFLSSELGPGKQLRGPHLIPHCLVAWPHYPAFLPPGST